MKSVIIAAGLAAVAQAFTQPGQQTYGALLTPNSASPVTTGQTYQVTWDGSSSTAGQTVSLVLCNGPSANCVLQNSAIVEGVPASQGSYSWSVPCSLPAGVATTATGYGMLIIVDGTGQFQYSTQFSVNTGSSCGSSSSSSSTTSSSSSSSSPSAPTSSVSASIPSGPPSILSTTGSGWYGWSSSFNTSTVAAPTGSAGYSSWAAATTTQASASASYKPSGSVSAPPQQFTGAAAVPSSFVNAAGLIGAAALAVLAL